MPFFPPKRRELGRSVLHSHYRVNCIEGKCRYRPTRTATLTYRPQICTSLEVVRQNLGAVLTVEGSTQSKQFNVLYMRRSEHKASRVRPNCPDQQPQAGPSKDHQNCRRSASLKSRRNVGRPPTNGLAVDAEDISAITPHGERYERSLRWDP